MAGPQAAPAPARRAWLLRAGLLAVAVAVVLAAPRLIGEIDWDEVGSAFGALAWWQLLVLAAMVMPRQFAKALPMTIFVRGLSASRALVSDLGTVLMLAVAPPPSYMALRLAMFDSWGIHVAKAMAGSLLGTAAFQFVRYSTPAAGFALVLAVGRPAGYHWAELGFVGIAVAIVVVLAQIARSDALARAVGVTGAKVLRRVRSSADPTRWGDACVRFRADVADGFAVRFARSTVAIIAMVAIDFTILALSLRFVGVSASQVSLTDLAIAYLFAYPLTFLPFSGLGVVDTIILAGLVDQAGSGAESEALAALVLWRIFTIGQPIVMGVVAVASWRRMTD